MARSTLLSETLPTEFDPWLAGAPDLEICRAVVEEPHHFRPLALAGIRAEIARRALAPESVVRTYRMNSIDRTRLSGPLLPGLILAGLGLVPAILPRSEDVAVEFFALGPSDRALLVQLDDVSVAVPSGSSRRVPLQRRLRRTFAGRFVRRMFGETWDLSVDVCVRTAGRAGEAAESTCVAGGRYLLSESGARFQICERDRATGRRVRTFELRALSVVIDLDHIPDPDGGFVALHRIGDFRLERRVSGEEAIERCLERAADTPR